MWCGIMSTHILCLVLGNVFLSILPTNCVGVGGVKSHGSTCNFAPDRVILKDGGKIGQCHAATKRNISRTVFIFVGIYCKYIWAASTPSLSLEWRLNERTGISNHRRLDCLLNRLFRRISKKATKLCVTGRCDHRWPVDSPHKGSVTRKMFPFDDIIMWCVHKHVCWDKQQSCKSLPAVGRSICPSMCQKIVLKYLHTIGNTIYPGRHQSLTVMRCGPEAPYPVNTALLSVRYCV